MRDEKGRFVPGESGNPHGRPPKEQSVTDLLDKTVDKQELVNKLIEIALEKGDMNALKYAIDRLDGKPRETVHQMIENLPEVIEIDLTADTGNGSAVEE